MHGTCITGVFFMNYLKRVCIISVFICLFCSAVFAGRITDDRELPYTNYAIIKIESDSELYDIDVKVVSRDSEVDYRITGNVLTSGEMELLNTLFAKSEDIAEKLTIAENEVNYSRNDNAEIKGTEETSNIHNEELREKDTVISDTLYNSGNESNNTEKHNIPAKEEEQENIDTPVAARNGGNGSSQKEVKKEEFFEINRKETVSDIDEKEDNIRVFHYKGKEIKATDEEVRKTVKEVIADTLKAKKNKEDVQKTPELETGAPETGVEQVSEKEEKLNENNEKTLINSSSSPREYMVLFYTADESGATYYAAADPSNEDLMNKIIKDTFNNL